MKVFHCDHCDHLVFFENTQCVQCGHLLAFLPDQLTVGSLEPIEGAAGLWALPDPSAPRYRLCANYQGAQVCNWAVDAADDNPLCLSCRLTKMIPDLALPENRVAWFRLEVAKRRVLYTLMTLGLPFDMPPEGMEPLAFQFLADNSPDLPVLTGHSAGMITINIAEADDAERERRRNLLGEPYRTLLGHIRHETGHYYWTLLVERQPERLEQCRALFGDDQEDYGAALARHYAAGPRPDWQDHFVTAYASAHAWEDWAETWAHYLHMTDTLEIAAACGVSLRPKRRDEPSLPRVSESALAPDGAFERLLESWFPLTYLLNNLNRGLGQADAYPFVLSTPALAKLRFVHECVGAAVEQARAWRAAREHAPAEAVPAPSSSVGPPQEAQTPALP